MGVVGVFERRMDGRMAEGAGPLGAQEPVAAPDPGSGGAGQVAGAVEAPAQAHDAAVRDLPPQGVGHGLGWPPTHQQPLGM